MTNTSLLLDRIERSGLKMGFIAKQLNISRSTLHRKINNVTYFNQYEIEKLCVLLRITSAKEREAIFFAKRVD